MSDLKGLVLLEDFLVEGILGNDSPLIHKEKFLNAINNINTTSNAQNSQSIFGKLKQKFVKLYRS